MMNELKIPAVDLIAILERDPDVTAKYQEIMNLCIKKCKSCGKEFFYYSRYNRLYCDKCVKDGATKTYKEKTKNDPLLKACSRAYKTHFARIRYGTLTKDEFKKWHEDAKLILVDAKAGRISFEEFCLLMKG
jgi:hypothetical protein